MMDGERKIRVVIYIRVSTQEQAQEGYSIDEQKRRLLAYCKARGWVVVEILVDPGFSGANLNRPGIQALISHIKDYDMVLVYKLDRLSRSQRDTLYLIEEVFLPNGVDFVSINESFDTSTPFGRAMIGILSVFAQLEREQIKERTAMGRSARFKEGKRVGARTPIGYDYDRESGILVVNEYEAMQIRLIFQMYLGSENEPGVGIQTICDYLQAHGYKHKYGDWKHRATLSAIIGNPVYVGDSQMNGEIVPNTHEAIISREVFDRMQFVRTTREDKYRGSGRSDNLLAGYLFCSCCGARVSLAARGGVGKKYYICYSRNRCNPMMVRDPNCKSISWRQEELEAIIDYEIRSLVFDDAALGRMMKKKETAVISPDNQTVVMTRQIEQLDKQIERIMDLYQSGTMPVEILNERVKKLYSEREQLAASLAALSPEESSAGIGLEETQAYLDTVAMIWDNATMEQKREIMSVLIKAIWIGDDNRVKIDWAFA